MLWLTQTLKHALKILESEAGAGGGTKFACKSVLIIIAKAFTFPSLPRAAAPTTTTTSLRRQPRR